MTIVDLGLVLVYTVVLMIKTCALSPIVCTNYGFGDTPKGKSRRRSCDFGRPCSRLPFPARHSHWEGP